MAVTHTQTIIAMAIVQSNSDNIVARVVVNTHSEGFVPFGATKNLENRAKQSSSRQIFQVQVFF